MSKVKNIPATCTSRDKQKMIRRLRTAEGKAIKEKRMALSKLAPFYRSPYSVKDTRDIREKYQVTVPGRWVPTKHLESFTLEYTDPKGSPCRIKSYRWVYEDRFIPEHTVTRTRYIESVPIKPYLQTTSKYERRKFLKRVASKRARRQADTLPSKGSGYKRSYDLWYEMW